MDGSQKYDIFISYRRATGANAARMMQLALTARGYSAFFDYSSLKDGKFNEAIYLAIDSCEVFILMMTEGALDRCAEEGDWVRLELQRAIEKGKHIVPIRPSDQVWKDFPDNLPKELAAICKEQVSKLDMETLFESSLDEIENYRFSKELRARRRQPGARMAGDDYLSSVTHAGEVFVGRDQEMGVLAKMLAEQKVPVITGAGGMGKSELVRQYAVRCRNAYPGGRFQVDMETARTWNDVFEKLLSGKLGNGQFVRDLLDDRRGEEKNMPLDVGQALLRRARRLGAVLLFLDNVESVGAFVGRDGRLTAFTTDFADGVRLDIVMTTRTSDVTLRPTGRVVELLLGDLSPAAAQELLLKNGHFGADDAERAAAMRVAQILNYRALYLRNVSALIGEYDASVACDSFVELERELQENLLETVDAGMKGRKECDQWRMMRVFDRECNILICCRRETSINVARMLQLGLILRGYSVLLDYDVYKDGEFNDAIGSAIDSCKEFFLVLTAGALDRCANEGDCVRREILRAIETKKHIVPVALSGQPWNYPPEFPTELSAIYAARVSMLDVGNRFKESLDEIENLRFTRDLRRCRWPQCLKFQRPLWPSNAPLSVVQDKGDAWVFLSHSHDDYDKVVQVRNLLEARKFRPLMFFLKCLEEDGEIDALIKREIDSRSRFVLCDSKSAKASRWVNEEVAYIKSKNRALEVIDLDSMTVDEIDAKLRAFEQRLIFTVLFSQSRQAEMVQVFARLQSYGFRVQWAVLDMRDDVSRYRNALGSFSRLGYVALYPDEDCKEFCASLTKDLFIEHNLWVVPIGGDLDLFDSIDRFGYEDAMILYQLDDAESRVKLLEQLAYGGRPTCKLVLGSIFARGVHGVEKDLRRALMYFKDAYTVDGMDTREHIKRIEDKLGLTSSEEIGDAGWVDILKDRLKFSDWSMKRKMSGRDWCNVLMVQPQFAEHCAWEELDGGDWSRILCSQPQFADRCVWEKLEGNDWASLLRIQPAQFADRCVWEKLEGGDWAELLGAQPQFMCCCKWEKLSGKDWLHLLCQRPEFAGICPWEKLNEEEWVELLRNQPQFAKWRKNKTAESHSDNV